MRATILPLTPVTPDLGHWEARVQLLVKPKRYAHVQRVALLAQQIAQANGLSEQEIEQAYAAGILHDIARDLPDSELLRLAPPECEIDARHPLALHGRAARTMLARWGYGDQTVLDAVEDHTTGPRGQRPVSACVYIADVSEPGRGVNDDIRELALHDLNAALNRAIVSKVTYLQGRGIQVHPRTLQCYESLPGVTSSAASIPFPPLQPSQNGAPSPHTASPHTSSTQPSSTEH
ncbi:bis(5'-nucleosyl)-tetraphosphatase (symmetrical) YqeK [Deinococcus fonticola]|uniref:bis(5'-nucleosyl)-tetraphosphatase (symmetrical) YqeK n=1 Tax=Deinococcus fonticola TaxID=2528713 RepID=UPI001431CB9B|nr:bis(5'-nucleosyl)-tetraphosphatase (symmetrical) YqeK [Deinococcus fonticola]